MSGGMQAEDVDICRNVIETLTAERYKDKNYVFLQPFDLTQTPGYLDVVPKVMDMETLSKNFEAGQYATRQSFFQDCFLVFENAIVYHINRKESKWIAKLGKEMLKVAKREERNLDKKKQPLPAAETKKPVSVPKPAAKPVAKPVGKMLLPTKKNKKSLAEVASKKDVTAPKLKLKIGGSSSTKSMGDIAAPAPVPAPAAKPKIKLKSPAAKQPPPTQQQQQQQQEPSPSPSETGEKKNKKPRLTLKLGKPKPSSSPKPSPSPATPDAASDKSPTESKPIEKVSTPKPTTSGSGKISIKMAAATGGSRGKELPKGVAPPTPKAEPKKPAKKSATKKMVIKAKKEKSPTAATTPETDKSVSAKAKSTSSKSKSKPKITLKPTASQTTNRGMMFMTPGRKAQCAKVLNSLKRRKPKEVWWFLQPVSDKNIINDYRSKIKNPMDLSTMETKVEKNQYLTIDAFVLDLRRILSNCMRYNTSSKTALRPVAADVLTTAEQLCIVFLAKPESPTVVYPPLLYCWKLCSSVLDTLFNLTNPGDGQPTALYFLHPVPTYTGGQWPDDYLGKVSKPMDFGTVTQQLIEGQYTSFDQFEADCRLVVDNCMAYYGGKPDGKVFTDQANRLKDVLQQQLEKTKKYLKSPAGMSLKNQAQVAVSTTTLPKPPIPLLLKIIEELRAVKYTDKATKVRSLF
jgi:hypothetical protein